MKFKTVLFAALFAVSTARAMPSDSERIADLERQVARLTEQVNILLAERSSGKRVENEAVYVCSLNVFTSHFRAENGNRGRARLDVLKQCRNKHDGMFCKNEDVRCEVYR